jgi:hypothetical protein
MAANEQGLLQVGNLYCFCLELLLNIELKVQVENQGAQWHSIKPQLKVNNDLLWNAPM